MTRPFARLVHTIESADRMAFLLADAGLGKSTVLRRAFDETRDLRRRFVLVSCPRDETLLVAMLAERLGERLGREPSRLASWRALERAVRIAAIQGIQIVIGIDDCERATGSVRRDIESVAHLAPGAKTRITVILAGRPKQSGGCEFSTPGTLAIGLESQTRTQTEVFLTTKLTAAGCDLPVFDARAITRLHCLSAGVPAHVERLARLSLMAGAAADLEVIPPELIDSVEDGCLRQGAAGESWTGRRQTQAG